MTMFHATTTWIFMISSSSVAKHGYSKVTDHAVREIRHKRISRQEGLSLVRQYERQPPQFLQLFADWLNLTTDGMSFLLDQPFRSPNFWLETSLQLGI